MKTSELSGVSGAAVRRRFGAVEALKGVDMVVPPGTSLALFGPNGAGKTTLLRVLTGLLRTTTGTVELFGTLPGTPQLRRRVGVVAHESFLYPDLSAAEDLRYYARLYGVADDNRPSELLASFGSKPSRGDPCARTRVECFSVFRSRARFFIAPTCFFSTNPSQGSIRRSARSCEAQGQAVMARPEIHVRVDLGAGTASARLWTCDLSHDYVRINAEYRS